MEKQKFNKKNDLKRRNKMCFVRKTRVDECIIK